MKNNNFCPCCGRPPERLSTVDLLIRSRVYSLAFDCLNGDKKALERLANFNASRSVIGSVSVAADSDSAQRGAAQGEAGEAPASDTPREAHPVGNTGTTSQKPTSRHGAAIPAVFSGVAHG